MMMMAITAMIMMMRIIFMMRKIPMMILTSLVTYDENVSFR